MRRVISIFLAAVLAVVTTASAVTAAPTSLRLLAVGDSINSGLGSPDGCGYRTEVTRLLQRANVTTTWTGPTAGTGVNDCPTGYRFSPTVQTLRDSINGWMASDTPDAVLITIGTRNAAGEGAGVNGFGAAYTDLVNRILTASPTVQVFVALIPYSVAPWAANEVTGVNTPIIQMVLWTFPNHPRVRWVDLQTYPPCLLWDGVHPSDYGPIARQWYNGLAAVYGLPAGPRDAYALRPWAQRPGFERDPMDGRC